VPKKFSNIILHDPPTTTALGQTRPKRIQS